MRDAEAHVAASEQGGVRFRTPGWYEVLLKGEWDTGDTQGTRVSHADSRAGASAQRGHPRRGALGTRTSGALAGERVIDSTRATLAALAAAGRTRRENEMPGKKKPGPSVKKPKTYEALRDKGMSKERAAKISNAQANKERNS